MATEKTIAKNKRASYEYEFVEKYTAGMSLTGTEVKSLRAGNVNFGDSFCTIDKGQMNLRSMQISPYKQGNIYNHEPLRVRKLLLKKQEIRKIEKRVKEKGLTIVPVRLFFSERGFAKLEIAVAKGKKVYDKRESIKQKDLKKQLKKIDY
jgi:SsrA-binding protein